MAKVRGIHSHNFFKLGKAPVKEDKRNLKLATFLVSKKLPPIPKEWDFDLSKPKYQIPVLMFANDQFGDCVMAGRAHQTLRFELLEQKKVITIKDQDVLREYWKEEGGKGPQYDKGLIVLDSLKLWRSKGWTVARRNYSIHAFAQIDQNKQSEVKAAIYLLAGAGGGLQLPVSAQTQLTAGKIWDVTHGNNAQIGSWGGHYVYFCGYTETGPVCITWGRKQQMTWAFLYKYCDELYGIVDNKNSFTRNSPIDVEKLENYLNEIS